MSNRYQLCVKENPLPDKTTVPNSIGWTSVEEMLIFIAEQKKENKKRDGSK